MDCFCAWVKDGYLPHDFNLAFLWVLPKGDEPDDSNFQCVRGPRDTRPLSGSNTDAKLFASVLCHKIESSLPRWANPAQRGSIKGRNLLSNILDLEREFFQKLEKYR